MQDNTSTPDAQESNSLYSSALNNMITAVMMVDRDLKITYLNKATIELLGKHEIKFQNIWPNFKANEQFLIGTCIDTFHKNPDHQRRLLSDPKQLPIRTDINIDDLIIELNVSAILDSQGQYIGNTLEWYDVTAARYAEDKAKRLEGAVEQSGTPSMTIDRDFNITYYNRATLELLKKHEATFQKKWPTFKADEQFLKARVWTCSTSAPNINASCYPIPQICPGKVI